MPEYFYKVEDKQREVKIKKDPRGPKGISKKTIERIDSQESTHKHRGHEREEGKQNLVAAPRVTILSRRSDKHEDWQRELNQKDEPDELCICEWSKIVRQKDEWTQDEKAAK